MMKYLQKLGKALMLPVAALPVAGILMGVGYLLAPAVMGAAGDTTGFAYTAGFLLIKAGGALIDNMAWLFAVGAAVGLADDHDGTAGLAGLVAFLMIQQLLSPAVVQTVQGISDPDAWLATTEGIAFSKIAGNSFIGILSAVIGGTCYNKFKDTRLPDWLAFFSGKRCVAIMTAVICIVVSVVLLFVWPLIFGALVALGDGISKMGGIGAGIYAFLNRLLIPTGLHHALNNVFWFDTIGLGDLTHFWAGETSADVKWSLGMYMSGFFPCMMFGIPGAALAMVQTAKNKKAAIGLVVSAAICAFVCGVTEPFEFGFMFLCFPLYVVYAALYGIFTIITYYVGFRAGFCFSAGATDLLFSASLPAAANTWMIIPLGIAAFLVFYLVFRFAITKFDLMTPGREDEDVEETSVSAAAGDDKFAAEAAAVLAAVGGKENVKTVDCCATRLRFELGDSALVDEAACKKAGALGVMIINKGAAQVIIGTQVQAVAEELKKLL
ncbi:PTS transporter subunit EIIC [Collinsella aerofaciens]|uniref:PTS transporter subunit EIIC n=1 Tax=Collinsella aerofaciens TaxID=74426 RepID=UPI00359C3231